MNDWQLTIALVELGHKSGPEFRFECPVCGQTFADILKYWLACL
jgi:hypothetical protein